MKIVSFPHYTCGGLLCDMLNNTFGPVGSHGGIHSIYDFYGKIGDGKNSINDTFSEQTFFAALDNFSVIKKDVWIGTHCWLGAIDLDSAQINSVISVSTETYRSKLYRWSRAYHHYFKKTLNWQNLRGCGVHELDKHRETAKNYMIPFATINHPKVINLEFSDVVENKTAFLSLFDQDVTKHINRWHDINSFLYDNEIWQSAAALRLHEAEHELLHNTPYRYA